MCVNAHVGMFLRMQTPKKRGKVGLHTILTTKIQFSEPLHLDECPNERANFAIADIIPWSNEQK